jgi:hypothetical protein
MLSFQTLTKADDISDFEIEGMSIGDSALNFFSENELKSNKQKSQYPNDKFIIRSFYLHNNFKTYEMVTVNHKKNDNKYIIESLGASIFLDDFNECFSMKKNIMIEFDQTFKNSIKDSGQVKKSFDKTGNSLSYITEYYLSDGSVIQVTCDNWSEILEQQGFKDSLNVNLQSKKFSDFLTIAYD